MKMEMIKLLSKTNPKSLKGVALLRLDFNTEDDWRLIAALPTVRFLLRTAEKVVIVSHKGRPPVLKTGFSGSLSSAQKKFSLRADATKLQRLIQRRVRFISRLDFEEAKNEIEKAPRGAIFLLENLRFMKGEEENNPKFARTLASLADFYVNDAFAVSHRANASVVAITIFLPSYAGLGLEKEIASLSQVMQHPVRPLALIVGGAKVSDKLGVLKQFKNKADRILVGGAAANTILFLKGMDMKESLYEKDPAELRRLKEILTYKNMLLPIDFSWGGDAILDIGPKSAAYFGKIVGAAKTIIWSGPLGQTGKKPFDKGSIAMARAIVKNKKAFSVSGGGETVEFLKQHGFDKKFSFISTGGGAMLDFLAGKKLPGIEALKK